MSLLRRITPLDTVTEEAVGNIPQYSGIFFSGDSESIGTTTQTLWFNGGDYPHITTAQKILFSSASANDTLLGTGARTLFVELIDENYDRVFELIDMNGTTDVSSVNDAVAVNSIFVLGRGSLKVNDGIILAKRASDNGVVGGVNAGVGLQHMPICTVPAGKVWIAKSFFGSPGNNDEISMQAVAVNEAAESTVITNNFMSGPYPFTNVVGAEFGEKQTVKVTAKSLSAGNKKASVILQFREYDASAINL